MTERNEMPHSFFDSIRLLPLSFLLATFLTCHVGCDRQPEVKSQHSDITKSPQADETALIFPENAGITREEFESWFRSGPASPKELVHIDTESLEMLRNGAKSFDIRHFVFDETLKTAISESPNLLWLKVNERASSDDLDWICKLTRLRGLSLRKADLKNSDLSKLGSLKQLRFLNLLHAELPKNGDPKLPFLPELSFLSLSGPSVTDEWLPISGQFPHLVSAELWDTYVSNEGLASFIEANPKLKYLHIAHSSNISNDSIDELATLKELRYIHIGTLDINRDELQKRLPHCFIARGT